MTGIVLLSRTAVNEEVTYAITLLTKIHGNYCTKTLTVQK